MPFVVFAALAVLTVVAFLAVVWLVVRRWL
jgi:hypothetical protein